MTSLNARIVVALRAHHHELATLVAALTDEQLAIASGAAPWRISDVLSHLGSGAEIMLHPLQAAVIGEPVHESDDQVVWDRWNAARPQEQASWFVQHDAVLVTALESLSDEQLETLRIEVGFLSEPVPFAVFAGMRLNEVALHTWDVLAGLDPAATLDEEAAEILLDLLAGPLGFLLSFSARPEAAPEAAVVAFSGRGLIIEDVVSIEDERPLAPTATLVAQTEAFVRLMGGRLMAAYTPQTVSITGNVTLNDLRAVFPGF